MNVELLAMIGAVLVASVVGSLHCAGMCGAFVAMAVGLDREASKARLIAAYNGGRLVTYTLIGVLAGWLGGAFDSGAELVGLQRGAAALAAATMIVIGTAAFLKALGVRLPRVRGPKAVQGAFVHVARVSVRFSPAKRAGAIGLATGLLPCGWLYAFALLAAGTAHPVAGGLVMAAFWMGTLPMLVSLGAGVRLIAGSVGRAAPAAMALVIIALGIGAATGRVGVEVSRFGEIDAQAVLVAGEAEPLPCCAPGVDEADLSEIGS